MRKGLLLFCAFALLFAFAACASQDETLSPSKSPAATTEIPQESFEPTPTEDVTVEPTIELTPTPTATAELKEKWLLSEDGWAWIENQSTEIKDGIVLEKVTVGMESKGSFVQLDHLLTELIGKNGQDGKGYIQIVVGDGTAAQMADAYMLVQLVSSSYTGYHIPGTPSYDAITWYPRGNGLDTGFCSIFLNQGGTNTVPNLPYGKHSNVCTEGYKFTFTRTEDGKVCIRSLNANSDSAIQNFDSKLNSEYALADLVGDGGKTGEDGVYFRLASYSSTEQFFTITVAYPA